MFRCTPRPGKQQRIPPLPCTFSSATAVASAQSTSHASQSTFAEACAHPSAKRVTVHGRTGPVNAVEADGALFIENDEAEAESVRLKVLEPLCHTNPRSTIHDNHHEHPPTLPPAAPHHLSCGPTATVVPNTLLAQTGPAS